MPVRSPIQLVLLLLVFSLPTGQPAVAEQVTTLTDCEKSSFSGSWVSNDPDVPFLSKLVIHDVCKQIISKPVAGNNPWAGDLGREKKYIHRDYTLRPSSTCSPIDCSWGKRRAKMSVKGVLKARFSMFWSRRYLELTQEKDTLRVRWRIEYTGRRKPDQLGETLMVRGS